MSEDLGRLAGAYVLGALTEEERRQFEQYLEGSEDARAEVASLSDTSVQLGFATTPVTPRPELRAALLAQIAVTPQLGHVPPAPFAGTGDEGAADEAAGGAGARVENPRVSGAGISGAAASRGHAAAGADDSAPDDVSRPAVRAAAGSPDARWSDAGSPDARWSGTGSRDAGSRDAGSSDTADVRAAHRGGPAERRAAARWFSRPAVAITSIAAAAALIFGGTVLGATLFRDPAGETGQTQAQATAFAELSAAGDVRRIEADLGDGSTATVLWSAELERAAIVATDVPTLPDGRIFAVWAIDESGTKPAGTFIRSDSASTVRVLDDSWVPGDSVGVSVEPKGGSPAPTTDPLFVVATL